MSTRPRGAMTKASAFFVGTIVVACPPAISDTLTPAINESLEGCSSDLKEDATGWQRLQLVLASRDDWLEMCAEQIQSDLKAAADRDYDSGTLTDQNFRLRRDDIDKHVANQKPADIAVEKYNDPSVEQFIVVDGKAAEERTIETLPGYKTISK